METVKRTAWIILVMVLWAASAFGAEVTNLRIVQEGGRGVFTYDLTAEAEEQEADVAVTVTVAGKSYDARDLHLEGDFGKVRSGKGKRITWNILQDFPKGLRADVDVDVTAGGGPSIANTTGMKFVLVPAGSFMMGSPASEPGRYDNETQHRVTISRAFYMQTTEVTQGQWRRVMGNNPSYFKDCGDDCPVEQVSWNDVQEFIRKLNGLEGTDKYRLPTEAEWEYAARAGRQTPFSTGNCLNTDQANYDGNNPLSGCAKGEYRQKTVRVGSFSSNAWGLYDMHGNVWEWVQDWYDSYPAGSVTDPSGPSSGSYRVVRGGSWDVSARFCRSADRVSHDPGFRHLRLGFRLLRTR